MLGVYEFVRLLRVLSTGFTFLDMVCVVVRLGNPDSFPSRRRWSRFLRSLEPDSLRRKGTLFIGAVVNAHLIFALLPVARLSRLGIVRWRWWFVIGESETPINRVP